ncbi:MAG: TetR/AcrR family transcriptional regulator [Pseudomonadota bacterium]
MARSLEFEPGEAVENAMMVFWRKGFEATSVTDLEVETGVGRKSLYRTFHDKHDLFLKALETYRRLLSARNLAPMMEPDAGLDTISRFLRGLAAYGGTEEAKMGCLICNTALERSTDDPEAARQVHLYFDQIRRAFANALQGAIRCRELPADTDVSRYANYLLGVLQSICVLGRSGADADVILDVVETALAALR